MHTWTVHDAKARFSELLDTCIQEGPQLVTRRGADAAILVPIAQWQRLNPVAHATLKELLLSEVGRVDLVLPTRGRTNRRRNSTL
ncbi:type II toxin-antitoxin system Phd/YefM family antitoxin [Actimicrobium sp. CCI2.3]|uniref:type II toxin-antitoxin system Phd/YefM family antitoxin n=1 Tax=Actimicrobium sp. CCI2.3 TaxID=3048616 RepID=UPI002AB57F2D|nr:type II toxin-antitoxin system Phd/YefM family antitoxin [Actimicrobium sp. CCI2.3]MDY7573836.1 type II toxin-antitoxin system Phd/YefM family antitoxin [Actimicrobium sp. CCI2.3]MEB0022447.1 type II toxin-antitoxin system Phd/YefM family antitoxin [Actimicrobium sp. CCI2.3]